MCITELMKYAERYKFEIQSQATIIAFCKFVQSIIVVIIIIIFKPVDSTWGKSQLILCLQQMAARVQFQSSSTAPQRPVCSGGEAGDQWHKIEEN